MKTIGEIIRTSRLDHGLTLDGLSKTTRIDTRYIQALEENDFQKLPSATFTKGFVRNLAQALGKDPGEWVALLRRDYSAGSSESVTPPHRKKISLGNIFQSQALILFLGSLVFVGYLGFQYRAVLTPPPLEINSPAKNAVIVSPVTIEGKTDSGTTVTINDELKIVPDSSGRFLTKLNLSPGSVEIKISVSNRFGRSTAKTIPITIVSQ